MFVCVSPFVINMGSLTDDPFRNLFSVLAPPPFEYELPKKQLMTNRYLLAGGYGRHCRMGRTLQSLMNCNCFSVCFAARTFCFFLPSSPPNPSFPLSLRHVNGSQLVLQSL